MKKNCTNKLLAVITALVMLLTMTGLAVTANAAAYDTANATSFVFSDDEITVTEGDYTGYKVKNTALSVTQAGTYIVSGSCVDGSIVVKKNVTGVTLILDGLTLTAHATAPITCNKGSGVTIVAAAGSVNNLADDQYNNDDVYTDETTYPDIENAVIKCKDGSNVTKRYWHDQRERLRQERRKGRRGSLRRRRGRQLHRYAALHRFIDH